MTFAKEKLLSLAPELAELFENMTFDRKAICSQIVDILRPKLSEFAPEPREGWLPCAYASLTNGLFPDPEYQAPDEATQNALSYLIDALNKLFACEDAVFDPLTDLYPFEETQTSRVQAEYERFKRSIAQSHFITTVRIGREIMPFDAASHTIGVRNVAVHTAIMAQQVGMPVDVALVAAAALCHDIGKFACRGEDAKRIPYLHYYYTLQWLNDRNMPLIAHISANHSTWDLEFENLPIESLLLIYADFRVRGTRQDGREVVRIYSLAQAYEMIMSKLSDMTEAKVKRYRLVYCKLRDFEKYLNDRGVCTDLECTRSTPSRAADAAVLSGTEVLDALRDLTFENNIRLMHTISTDASFDLLLEQARGERNAQSIRTYLHLFDEYSTYMTSGNKKKLLAYLYELLMSPESDIRRIAGNIMGQILANSGPKYRKELPSAAPKSAMAPTMLALLDESVSLWDSYVRLCLYPDHKIAQKHALRISNSLKAICETLFTDAEEALAVQMAQVLISYLPTLTPNESFSVLDALCHIPCDLIDAPMMATIAPTLDQMLRSGTARWQIVALTCLDHLRTKADAELLHLAQTLTDVESPAVSYLRHKFFREDPFVLSEQDISILYLSNLKNAVHWTIKNVQIDMLCDDLDRNPTHAFHTAMHLSNLLSVSEHLPVREHAGNALLSICDYLTVDQRNEISVDLMRELENGQEQIARFIPQYVGKLVCTLPEKEVCESVYFLEGLLRSGAVRPAGPVLRTLGSLIGTLPEDSVELIDDCLGLLLTGIAHYNSAIHRNALSVLCHDILANEKLPVSLRRYCFVRVSKKLLCLLCEPSEGQLTFFNRAAMLNHIYRFMVRHEIECGELSFPKQKPVAFFPGTFDPFSAGHKCIVKEILSRGFEVYLAIDEFSWSKRTLPKLLRRKIAQMSAADQWDTYVFPDHIPVNIAVWQDLETLRSIFPDRGVYLVAGSDVIHNASAYRGENSKTSHFDHIIIRRPASQEEGLPAMRELLRGKLIEFDLPEQLSDISSTRIRESIDKNMDISALVDPIVQAYIYEYGLYLRSPMYKQILRAQDYEFRTAGLNTAPPELFKRLHHVSRPRVVVLHEKTRHRDIAWACAHSITISELYDELQDVEVCSLVRRCTSGKLLMLDGYHCDDVWVRPLLNELLVRSLSDDHTYALCRCNDDKLRATLQQLGFICVDDAPGLYYVDMRAPMILIQDVLQRIKQPHRSDAGVTQAIIEARPKLRNALCTLYPGKLLLSFDSEYLNQSLLYRVQKHNGVSDAEGPSLGKQMCVPYGKILSDQIVPNTVTKTLHADKTFIPDGSRFTIEEYPGYSSLENQIRTIKSFRRPLLLVDDILHKGNRIAKLTPLFTREKVEVSRIIVGICSGRGRDLMRKQGQQVDYEYFIPNLHYWVTESLLYPFLGGDSVSEREAHGRMLPSLNLILPYYYPRYFVGTNDQAIRHFSKTALENTFCILKALEHAHQQTFNTALTLGKLGEAVSQPRLPDRGKQLSYDFSVPASAYLQDDLLQLDRIRMRGDLSGGI